MTEKDEASIPVRLGDVDLVWLKEADGSGALAYPEHVDDDGQVKWDHVFSDSFAHVQSDGTIRRYGATIGSRDDLVQRS
jgi:hypothetical protein